MVVLSIGAEAQIEYTITNIDPIFLNIILNSQLPPTHLLLSNILRRNLEPHPLGVERDFDILQEFLILGV